MAGRLDSIGRTIARRLQNLAQGRDVHILRCQAALRNSLRPGDVLLVEGDSRIAGIIKYLTQSTWSHAALYVGAIENASAAKGEPHVLVEAELGEGVISAPLSKYDLYHT